MRETLRVLLVDEHTDGERSLVGTLESAGCVVVARHLGPVDLWAALALSRADVVIVDMVSPDAAVIDDVRRITEETPCPVVMFVEEDDLASIEAAVLAGVSAYVVKGANPERVRPVLDVACARFASFQALRVELEQARSDLAERKAVERAKGILMAKRGLSEQDAFSMLRKAAMQRSERLGDLAGHVIATGDLA